MTRRGRPPSPAHKRRKVAVQARFTETEAAALYSVAGRCRRPLAELVRTVCLAVLLDERGAVRTYSR